jgi:hypothetical protein
VEHAHVLKVLVSWKADVPLWGLLRGVASTKRLQQDCTAVNMRPSQSADVTARNLSLRLAARGAVALFCECMQSRAMVLFAAH